jgi:predicted nuclease of predicted toxin-antitoxin system
MRFLVDECTGPKVARWLREQGHEVFSVYDEARGVEDETIIRKAFAESWILITNDKDFGEKVYKERRQHKGVVFLRLEDERAANKIERCADCWKAMQIGCPITLSSSPRRAFASPACSAVGCVDNFNHHAEHVHPCVAATLGELASK